MPELFSILFKINVALILFCAGYYLVLRRLTFYTLNRTYLVTGIIFSSVYPFIDLSMFAERNQEILAPVQNVVINFKAPAENFVKQASYWNWLELAFWAGVIVFALRFAMQLVALYSIYRRSEAADINGQKIRVVKGDISPFSFWQSIFINPDKLSKADLQNVLEHERIHVNEWHTLDVLLTEISVILYWFNPGVWMMKRAVRENIEFITDRRILQKGADSKAYQYSLLNITFNQPAPAITSNFNFSTLKKRIIMMNAKRSSNLNLTRYALLVPVVVVCLLTFSLAKAEARKIDKAIKQIAVTVAKITPETFKADTTPFKRVTPVKRATPVKKADAQSSIQKKEVVVEAIAKGPSIILRNLGSEDSIVYVIDGKIKTAQDFNSLDFNEIEGVNIMNDNASAYIFKITGVANIKATNAIIVTLKKKTTGAVNVTDKNVDHYGSSAERGIIDKPVQLYTYLNRTHQSPIDTEEVTKWRGITGKVKEPLIVVDGLILAEGQDAFKKIPADVIQSINILKDGSATRLYGEKAKDGVIMITTRRTK